MKISKRAEKLKYWQAMKSAYEGSGLSLKAFCLSRNISYKNFLNYRYRTKQSSTPNSSLFIPVAIKTDHEAVEANMSVNASPLTLVLNSNVQLQIPIEAVSRNLLCAVFSALEVL